jgi:hypothetical protein
MNAKVPGILQCQQCRYFRCEVIPERQQNAFAALAGSGPAYIYQVRVLLPCRTYLYRLHLQITGTGIILHNVWLLR